ncbi:hypothetical protein VTK26DRAFT_5642 [Humicola hyalothermophila]
MARVDAWLIDWDRSALVGRFEPQTPTIHQAPACNSVSVDCVWTTWKPASVLREPKILQDRAQRLGTTGGKCVPLLSVSVPAVTLYQGTDSTYLWNPLPMLPQKQGLSASGQRSISSLHLQGTNTPPQWKKTPSPSRPPPFFFIFHDGLTVRPNRFRSSPPSLRPNFQETSQLKENISPSCARHLIIDSISHYSNKTPFDPRSVTPVAYPSYLRATKSLSRQIDPSLSSCALLKLGAPDPRHRCLLCNGGFLWISILQ